MAVFLALETVLVSFFVVAVSTPLIRRFALRWKLGDKPNGRKVHTSTIPHLGGVGLVAGAAAGVAAYLLSAQSGGNGTGTFVSKFFVPVLLIVVLGLTDDMKNLRAIQKLAVQILAALLLAISGFVLRVGIPGVDASAAFILLLTTFYLVGLSSAVNLIDGHDGLAAGLSIISAAAFAVAAYGVGSEPALCVSLALVGACLGFLLYNFPPGRIFMGDTGSMFLGITLGVIACSLTMRRPSLSTFFGVSLILAVPMVDAWLAIARRIALRRPVFQADCMHVHHVLSSFGFSPRQTLAILYLMQGVLATLGCLAMSGFVVPMVVGVVILVLIFVTFLRVMVSSLGLGETAPSHASFVPSSVPSLEK